MTSIFYMEFFENSSQVYFIVVKNDLYPKDSPFFLSVSVSVCLSHSLTRFLIKK